ncbi:MAG TPA: isochorismatase family cysteine hydrolase [Actinomycetota bacterium]|nr:isochorismatase family cysteine hydrolase [Actinomycetota bacterium]
MPGPVLLVIDTQEGFTRKGSLASEHTTAAIPRIVHVAERERGAGTPIIFTKDTHREGDPEFEMFPPHCLEGTEEHELVEELRPLERDAHEIVHKSRYSAFHGTDLDALLEKLDPDEVRVAGVCTDICVLHTVADLRNRDYRVLVHRDAVETFDAPGHDHADVNRWALSHIENILGAQVV